MSLDGAPAPARVAVGLREHARRTPDRLAAWDVERSATYAELDALVGALALRIAERRADLGACGVLPLLVGRDLGSLVAIQAAIRAGVAYAPIDAGLAPGALAGLLHRLDDPRIAVVTRPGPTHALPAGVAQLPALGKTHDGLDPVAVHAGSMGRLVFTSGSSGEPKGVAISWGAGDRVLQSHLFGAPPGPADQRALSVAPMSFAAGIVAAVRPSAGVALSILDPNALDPADLLERVDADRLGIVELVPSHLVAVLSRWPAGRRLESVRSITAFGEALDWSMVPLMRRLVPDTAVVANAYGSTEGGRPGLATRIGASAPLGVGRVPLGQLADAPSVRLEPVPDADDLREIVVVGDSVALGYWRDPELTARLFGTDPDGVRFWRSGDLVRVDADDVLHFVGRRDNVTKINGMLVEPSEPERVLGAVPGVARAVVLVQPAPRGGRRLVAHVEVEPGSDARPAAVRAAVADAVAEHLVPAVLVRHDRLPVTDRGKVDRQALLHADVVPWHDGGPDRASSMDEAAVLAIASELLGVDRIGPEDDLWELGLDSLGATELLATLTDFGWPAMPESVLLDHRTAAQIDLLRRASVRNHDIRLNADATGGTVVCVLSPAGDPLTFRMLAQCVGSGHRIDILHQFDFLATTPPARTVEEIAASLHDRVGPLRASGPATVVGYSGSGVVAYELARRFAADGADARVVLLDSSAGKAAPVQRSRRDVSVARRLRRASRQAWLRALPPGTMPQRQRARAVYEIAMNAPWCYYPPRSDLPVTLFVAKNGGLSGLVQGWTPVADDLTVVELDCDHFTILGLPHIAGVADRIREAADRRSSTPTMRRHGL